MALAQALIFRLQTEKFSPQTSKILNFLIYAFVFLIVVLLVISMGFMGCMAAPRRTESAKRETEALETIEIKENELDVWISKMQGKFARYKISCPEKGIVHAKGVYSIGNNLVRVNILQVNKKINPLIEVKPEIASARLNSRVKIRTIAQKNNSIAAVNGGYFKPQTGVPLGALMIDGELLAGPVYNRAAIGINPDGTYSIGKTDIKFNLKNKNVEMRIDNVNQPRMLSTYAILYTDKWGQNSPPPPKYGANLVIEGGKAICLYHTSVQIPKGGYVLSAPEKSLLKLLHQKGLKFNVEYPHQFKNSVHIISGGPFLIKDGEIFIDATEEKLSAVQGRNPRTLMGYTENNELIIATVDGREKSSIGMSLVEAAKFMQKLGCKNAINLDGGSSSVMYLNGRITNTPPVEGGIPISGALTVNVNKAVAGEKDKNSAI